MAQSSIYYSLKFMSLPQIPNNSKRTILSVVLATILSVSLTHHIYTNRSVYLSTYDIEYWSREFSVSQVVMGGRAEHFLSDSQLYAIVGYKYVSGEDPTKVHPEVPPLGKLLVGLSIKIFGNENMGNLVLGMIVLWIIYLIGMQIFSDSSWSLFTVLLVSLDTQFRHSLIDSNIDVPQLLFISISLFFAIKAHKKPQYFYLASLSLGLMMATKFYANGLVLLFAILFTLLIEGDFKIFISFIYSLPMILLGYAIPYLKTFTNGMDLVSFIKFQRWLTSWWAGNARVPIGGILLIIATGWWRTWWTGSLYVKVEQWNILWPVSILIALCSVFFMKKGQNYASYILWSWCAVYLVFASLTSAFPRYLIAISPFANLLVAFTIHKLLALLTNSYKIVS